MIFIKHWEIQKQSDATFTVIRKNEGTPNKDLERFSRDVQSLCDKWDRTDM